MKKHTTISAILLVACGLYSGMNWAHGGGGGHGGGGHMGGGGGHFGYGGGFHGGYYGGYRGGLYFGLGFPYYGYGYGYPYYGYPYAYPYYSPAVVAAPQTYIQQPAPVTQQNPAGYWYYCNNPEGYYPYVKACPNGWQQVSPTPPSAQ